MTSQDHGGELHRELRRPAGGDRSRGGRISKVGAVLLGARAAGMPLDREVWAIGFGLNARGATGIILAASA